MNIMIEKAYSNSLWGRPENNETNDLKGENSYAA
jgi:hypothetical protein